ncbi:hypothetical protein BDZ89DRAFT_435110 [Hymenopellis radicata]|nr:hypothetical protein BDZ89DRAFT_435110 [Hymenopellis radicata]
MAPIRSLLAFARVLPFNHTHLHRHLCPPSSLLSFIPPKHPPRCPRRVIHSRRMNKGSRIPGSSVAQPTILWTMAGATTPLTRPASTPMISILGTHTLLDTLSLRHRITTLRIILSTMARTPTHSTLRISSIIMDLYLRTPQSTLATLHPISTALTLIPHTKALMAFRISGFWVRTKRRRAKPGTPFDSSAIPHEPLFKFPQ